MSKCVADGLLGAMHVKIWIDGGCGGANFVMPGGQLLYGKISLHITDTKHEKHVRDALWHECIEMYLLAAQLGYGPLYIADKSEENRLFVMTHTQMNEMVSDVADFVTHVWPSITKAWKEGHKKRVKP